MIRSNMLYSYVQAYAAQRYNDQLQVRFMERDFSDAEKADKWTKMAKFDKEEMNYDQEAFVKDIDCAMTGVGIIEFIGWDSKSMRPLISQRDPMAWLPDPKGWLNADKFRWHGFQVMENEEYMRDNGFDVDNIELFPVMPDQDLWTYDPYNGMPPNTEMQLNSKISYREVLYWYMDWDGHKYQIAVNRAFNKVGRIMRTGDYMQAPDGSEPYPLSLWYCKPERHQPFSISYPDLLRDKHMGTQELLNLQFIKVKRNSLGNHRLYDKNKIPNRADLGNPLVDPQLIGIDIKAGENLSNVFWEIPYQELNQDNPLGINTLADQAKLATFIDPIQMGVNVAQDEDATATEIQDRQNNANEMIAYGNTITNRGDKDFWTKYTYMYQTNRQGAKKKIMRITNALGYSTFEEVSRKQLKTKKNIDVAIVSRSEAQQQQTQKVNTINQLRPLIAQINDQSPYNQRFAARYLCQQSGLDTETTNFLVGQTGEEMRATQQLQLLNRNEKLDEKAIDVMYDNHDAYLYVYRQALDTPAKREAIQQRMQAKIDQAKMIRQQAESPAPTTSS